MNDEDIDDGLSLMRSAGFDAAEASRIVIDVNLDRDDGEPVTPDIIAAYADLERRLIAATTVH